MANLEVLALDTAVPQIRAPGAGDGYSVPRDMTFASGTVLSAPTVDATNVEVTNIKAKDGTAAASIADSTGVVSITANPILSGGTANGVLYLNGSKVATSGSALQFSGTNLSVGAAVTSTTWSQFVGVQANYPGFVFDSTASGGKKWCIGADAGTLLFRNETDTLSAAVITSTGNLGIGTTSPSARVDIRGSGAQTLYFVSTTGSNQTNVIASLFNNGAAYSNLALDGNTLLFRSGASATEAARIDSSGNLGLGVTPPAANTVRQLFVGSRAMLGSASDTHLTHNAVYNSNWLYRESSFASMYQQASGRHEWYTAPTGTAGNAITFTQAMTLDASGNLALGTTSAAGLFHMAKGGGYGYQLVDSYGPGYHGLVDFRNSRNSTVGSFTATNSGDNLLLMRMYGTNSGNTAFAHGASFTALQTAAAGATYVATALTFSTSDGTNAVTERARITAGGYFKASNNGAYFSSAATYHELRQTANDICVLASATDASYTSIIYYADTTRAANAGFSFASWRANGAAQFGVAGDGVIYAQNTTVQSISDGRLKENVSDATDGLNVINALRPVRYDWKAGYGNDRKNQLGFIAQEMETVFPEAVAEWKVRDDEEAYKTVGPGALIPVLVKAMQEQQAMINELKAKVAALESK